MLIFENHIRKLFIFENHTLQGADFRKTYSPDWEVKQILPIWNDFGKKSCTYTHKSFDFCPKSVKKTCDRFKFLENQRFLIDHLPKVVKNPGINFHQSTNFCGWIGTREPKPVRGTEILIPPPLARRRRDFLHFLCQFYIILRAF